VFDARTTRLIPLYALGVFLSFTLSQSGMVKHWLRIREPGWRRAAAVNGLGAIATAVVFVVILEAKFLDGAWVVTLLIPALAIVAWLIGRFYRSLRRALNVPREALLDLQPRGTSPIPVIVPVNDIDLSTVMTLGAACAQSHSVTGVHVIVDPDEVCTLDERWQAQFPHLPLVLIDSPYRAVAEPIAAYVSDRVHEPPYEVTVMVPIIEARHRYQGLLINQSLKRLVRLLAEQRHVTTIPFPVSAGGPGRSRRRADTGG